MDELDQKIEERKTVAHLNQDLEEYVFYSSVEREFKILRLAVTMAAKMYKNTGSDEAWTALYEALSDTGLLDT